MSGEARVGGEVEMLGDGGSGGVEKKGDGRGEEFEAARRGVLALLDGARRAGVSREECGRWWTLIEVLEQAWARGGTQRVRRLYDDVARANEEIAALATYEAAASDPERVCPPLPGHVWAMVGPWVEAGSWLDEYIGFAGEAAPMTPRSFHEAAGLFLASAAIGRLVVRKGMILFYPNLYLLWIGATTVYRKSTTVSVAQKVAREAGLQERMLLEDSTPEALLQEMSTSFPPSYGRWSPRQRERWLRQRALAAQRALLLDEAGGLFDSMQREQKANLLPLLLKLYDCPEELSEQTLARGANVVERPCLSFFGISTPAGMEPHLRNRRLWAKGLWRRFALIVPDAEPAWASGGSNRECPAELIDGLRRIETLFPRQEARLVEHQGEPYVEVVGKAEPTVVVLEDGVEKAWDTYAKATGHDMLLHGEIDELLHGCYGNLGAQAIKVAMLLAAMDTEAAPVRLERRHLARAVAIVEGWRASLHRLWSEELRTEQMRTEERVLKVLGGAGSAGLTVRTLCQRLRLPSAEVSKALKMLGEAGQARSRKMRGGNGREVEVWRVVGDG